MYENNRFHAKVRCHCCINKKQHRETIAQQTETLTVPPYIKTSYEMRACLLNAHEIAVALRSESTKRKILSETKVLTPGKNRADIVYQVYCKECKKRYTVQTENKVTKRIHGHQLPTKAQSTLSDFISRLSGRSQVPVQNVRVVARGTAASPREFFEFWHSSETSTYIHVDLDHV